MTMHYPVTLDDRIIAAVNEQPLTETNIADTLGVPLPNVRGALASLCLDPPHVLVCTDGDLFRPRTTEPPMPTWIPKSQLRRP